MATPCFQHDSYRRSCGDCRDMNGDDLPKPTPTTDSDELVERIERRIIVLEAFTGNTGCYADRDGTWTAKNLIAEIRARIQADAATIAGMQWQPIETAPRDGARVIVGKWAWVIEDTAAIFDENAHRIWHLCFAVAATFLPEKSYWTDGLERLVEPTHWMPLPNPPALKGGDHG